MHDRHDLSDEDWARLEPLLPAVTGRRGRRWADHRAVINGVLWRVRTGSPWRDLPCAYGNWKTVYHRHRRWAADGTWEQILDRLRTAADEQVAGEWWLAVDATVIRAHQHAAGARHAPPKDVPVQRLAPTVLEASEHPRPGTRGWVELQEFPLRSG